jgi:hypothetical protein
VAESELSGLLQPIVRDAATRFANASGVAIQGADAAIAGLTTALEKADATAQELREALEAQRARARQNVDDAPGQATALSREASALRARRDRAFELWDNTPIRELSLRASRRNAWLEAVAEYNVAAAKAAAQQAVVTAARRVLNALPPVDQNIALMTANAAIRALRGQLSTAQRTSSS